MSEKKWIHFIGIGGSGMSGIAKVLVELGYRISGSDLQISEVTKRLVSSGATIYLGHEENNLDSRVESVVVSSAIPRNNAEVMKARSLGIPVIQRAEMLGQLMKRQKGIAIAGAHGKTTTTSMVSLMFEKNGLDPTVVVGGELNDIGGNAKLGKGEYLVAEADESDGSFLKLQPMITLVTNIEDDHLDYYGTRENIENAFSEFIMATPAHGFTVLCLDDPVLQRLISRLRNGKKLYTYGFTDEADYYAKDLVLNGTETKAQIYCRDKYLGQLSLSIPGRHNILNALAAVVIGMNCGLDFEGIAASLQSFGGVQRRFQKVGDVEGIVIYDDYAHHPTEIKATLSAARTMNPKRLIAIFQPHRYSRTQLLFREFGSAFEESDVLIVDKIYAAGEKPIIGVDAQLIVNEVSQHTGQKVEYLTEKGAILSRLLEIVTPGDLVITLGAGNIWNVGFELYDNLNKKNKH
ncbi:MAG: UDP-N-acetylmuramate--L-alanine ligase [Firmicutes bacterium HGW-Firmicutes-12]|jgi:UDP-N-acetylmuramate--alanine ligase|nr:MAG: UDP-N-acetylmuramate--L-alanine ligase [Firmicutes bacterium HGW-Firmicutes-12]